jgi:hypothetical protein
VKYLLKRVEVNKPKQRRVVVVNWHRGKSRAQARVERERFDRFFGPLTLVEHRPRTSFEQFAHRPRAVLGTKTQKKVVVV